ncbi:MAG: hypothetical protein ABI581_16775 [Sediminibacterium sp.]
MKATLKENKCLRYLSMQTTYLSCMSERFELPLEYKGEELLLPAELLPMGFTHKIKVTIDSVDILFEPDEERNYRAVINNADLDKIPSLKKDLLQLICLTLDELFGNNGHSALV